MEPIITARRAFAILRADLESNEDAVEQYARSVLKRVFDNNKEGRESSPDPQQQQNHSDGSTIEVKQNDIRESER